MARVPFSRIVASLPFRVPFVAPEALERKSGRPIRLRLGANESAFGVSPRARQAMQEAAERVHRYADPESFCLRERLANTHAVRTQNLIVGSGIDDLLGLVVRTFLDPGSAAVTSRGGYPTFDYHVAGHGGIVHRVPYREHQNDLEALAEVASQVEARLVYIANPDNPTGTWHNKNRLLQFLDQVPAGCLVVLDEAYVEFVPPGDLLGINPDDARLIRLRTFSKIHGMAGARIGYAIAAPETIAAFDKIRLHFGVNMFAQAGALASLDDSTFVDRVRSEVAQGREEYYHLADELGLNAIRSATNFVAIDIRNVGAARHLLDTLFENGVFVRSPAVPPLDQYIRVTVGTRAERASFAACMRALNRESPIAGPRDR